MKHHKPVVFFNASVIIAGLINPKGGSGKLLEWVRSRKIIGLVSEIILEEVDRHIRESNINDIFLVTSPPVEKIVNKYNSIVIDPGDSHVLASAWELNVDYLVSHDKKHILTLKRKIKEFKIVSTKELIKRLYKTFAENCLKE